MQVTVALMAAPAKPELAFAGALQIGKCTVLLQWDTVYSVGAQQALIIGNKHSPAANLLKKNRLDLLDPTETSQPVFNCKPF